MAILQEEKSKKDKNKQKLNLFSTFEISTVLRKNKNGMNLVLKKWSNVNILWTLKEQLIYIWILWVFCNHTCCGPVSK